MRCSLAEEFGLVKMMVLRLSNAGVQVRAHAWRRHVNDIISLDSLFATIDLEWETDEGDVKKMRCHFVFPFHGDTRDFDFEISISLGIPDILAWL